MGNKRFMESIQSFDMNIVKKELVVTVRESCTCEIMPLIIKLAEYESTTMTWEGLEGSGKTLATMFFHGLKLIDHNFKQSYIDNGYAVHVLTFSYEKAEKE